MIIFRFILMIIMVSPAIVMALVSMKIDWVDLIYSFLMGVLFALNFLYIQRWLFKLLKCDVAGDFFNDSDDYEDVIWRHDSRNYYEMNEENSPK